MQMRDGYEQRYIERYWAISDDLLRTKHDGDVKSAEMHRERYLRLCEDEFEAQQLGKLSKRTWGVWHNAIQDVFLANSDEMRLLSATSTSEYDLLRSCIDGGRHSTEVCPAVVRATEPRRTTPGSKVTPRTESLLGDDE